jgi:hypothetical protein
MRRAGAVALLALAASACATLGREYPRCDFPFVDVPISIIMEIQALPDASYGPCLNDLAPGWTYHHMQHQSGRVNFWLDSDRLGDRFVEVTMTESCDPGSAASRAHPNSDIDRFVDATAELRPIDLTVVPIGPTAQDYAVEIGIELAEIPVRGRPLRIRLDNSGEPAEAIERARSRGDFIISVDDLDYRQDTVQIWVPGEATGDAATLAEAVDTIEGRVEEGSYRATWFHLFDGGCVTFEFDADGSGVETLVTDIEATIGFADLADLKEKAAAAGFVLDESELR